MKSDGICAVRIGTHSNQLGDSIEILTLSDSDVKRGVSCLHDSGTHKLRETESGVTNHWGGIRTASGVFTLAPAVMSAVTVPFRARLLKQTRWRGVHPSYKASTDISATTRVCERETVCNPPVQLPSRLHQL